MNEAAAEKPFTTIVLYAPLTTEESARNDEVMNAVVDDQDFAEAMEEQQSGLVCEWDKAPIGRYPVSRTVFFSMEYFYKLVSVTKEVAPEYKLVLRQDLFEACLRWLKLYPYELNDEILKEAEDLRMEEIAAGDDLLLDEKWLLNKELRPEQKNFFEALDDSEQVRESYFITDLIVAANTLGAHDLFDHLCLYIHSQMGGRTPEEIWATMELSEVGEAIRAQELAKEEAEKKQREEERLQRRANFLAEAKRRRDAEAQAASVTAQ